MLSETVDPSSGSLSVRISTPVPPTRGITIPFSFDYSSGAVKQAQVCGTTSGVTSGCWAVPTIVSGVALTSLGWSYRIPELTANQKQVTCQAQPTNETLTTNVWADYIFTDPSGSRHNLQVAHTEPLNGDCVYAQNPVNVSNGGDDFYSASLNETNGAAGGAVTVVGVDGTVYNFPATGFGGGYGVNAWLPSTIEDRNGNTVTISQGSGGSITETDTVGRSAVSTSAPVGQNGTVSISGLSNAYTVTWETIPAAYGSQNEQITEGYNDGCYWAGDGNTGSTSVIESIKLPNGTYYNFGYDSYGLLSQISYPTGAVVTYTWNTLSSPTGMIAFPDNLGNQTGCEYAYYAPMVTQRTVKFDGVHTALVQNFQYTTAYNAGVEQATVQTTVYSSDGSTNLGTFKTVYNYFAFTPTDLSSPDEWNTVASTIPVEQTVQYYDYGQANLIETVTKGWQDEHLLGCQLDTHDGSGLRGTFYSYGSGSVITDEKEYDYGQLSTSQCPQAAEGGPITAPAGPMRETATTYQVFADTPIFPSGPSILDRPSSVITYGNGNRIAETDYAYDQTGVTAASTPGGTHDETNYSASYNNRGNVTTMTKQCFNGPCAGGNPISTYTYDETGQTLSMTDPCGNSTCSDISDTHHTTTYSYTDNFDSPPSGNTNAYLTKITRPTTSSGASHVQTFKYAYSDGQLIASTDENSQQTQYSYNDSLRRLTETDYPDGGKTTVSYNDAPYNPSTPSPSVTTTQVATPDPSIVTLTAFDGLGHTVRSVLTSDPDCSSGDITNTAYDGTGHAYTVSNPYCTTSDPTYGMTTYAYDALGRTKRVTNPDNSTVLTTYAGPATQVQDEGNGTQPVTRISQSDALGRLTSVCEVSSSTLIGSSGTPTACGLAIGGTGFLTTYQYDALNNLLQVNQPGVVARTFVYDSLSRLTGVTNPESSTTAYSYDPNGNVTTKTDARGISTTFAYDSLNRVNSKTYSDGTPTATFFYDNASCCPYFNPALQNTIGRLVYSQTAGQAIDYFSYDAMGRTTYEYQAPPSIYGSGSYTVASGYDLAGNITSATNGVGVTFSYSYSAAARLQSLTSSLVDSNHPASILSNTTYNALAQPVSAKLGNGIAEALTYNLRAELQSISAGDVTSNGTPGTGSSTISGTEQSIPGAPAVAGAGSVTFAGTLQSKQVQTQPATAGTGTVTISGYEQSIQKCTHWLAGGDCQNYETIYDSGTVSITVNGVQESTTYSEHSTSSSIASALASAFNGNGSSPVTAVASGSVVTLTSKTTGSATNYSLSSASSTSDPRDFPGGPSFSTYQSGSALTGGANAVYTARYDSGTSTITVNGHGDTVSWSGSGTTASSIASSLASTINADSSASVTASVSGTIVSLTAKTTGASTDYALSSSYTFDSTDFSSSSFTSSNSGSTLTGGANAGSTVYDSGTVWVTVNGFQASVSYGQGSTSSTIAGAIANAFNTTGGSPVTASVSGSAITLTASTGGSSTDYSLSAGSSTSDPSQFSSPSFSVSTSGSSLIGARGPIYTVGIGYAPNGNVTSANDSANGNWTYAYDPFNRLACANLNNGTCASPTSGQATYTYQYDRFGNRWQQNGPNSMMLTFTGNNPNSPNNNNRMDGYSYDAAGNLLNDGVHTYTYDAENRVTQVDAGATATYIYDADGRRVRKTTGASVDYLYDISGHQIAEVNSSGSWNRGEVYAGGTHIATYNNGTTYFTHQDWLGTERVRSDMTGASCETIFSLPFGDGQAIAGSCDPTPMHFTGKERDSESNLGNFGARYNSSNLGRFMSPDPDNAGASPDNPQSWNAYSYVLNNPLVFTDPDGLWCVWGDGTHDDTPENGGAGSADCKTQGGYWDPGDYYLGFYENKNGNLVGWDSPDSSGLFSPPQQVTVTAAAPPLNPYGDPINEFIIKRIAPIATVISGFTGLNPAFCGPINMESKKPEDSDHPKKQSQADKDFYNLKEVKDSSPKRPGPAAQDNRNGAERAETTGSFAEVPGLVNNGLECIANMPAQQPH
jgi:RHS repeat-associated protein